MKKCTILIALVSIICLAFTLVYKYTHIDLVDSVRMNNKTLLKEKLKIYDDSFSLKDAILEAAYLGYPEPLEVLLQHNQNTQYYVNLYGLQCEFGLPYSCKNKECMDLLLRYGMTFEPIEKIAAHPVSDAIEAENYDLAAYLIKKGVDIGYSEYDREILNYVSYKSPGAGKMFEELLDSNVWGSYADSAMVYASAQGDINLIDKIVSKAGKSYLNNGLISIYECQYLDEYKKVFNRKSLEYLFEKGADPTSKKAFQLLNDAVDAGDYEIIKFLIDKGVPVDKNLLGFHYTDNKKIIELLIKKGANPNPDNLGENSSEFELPIIRAISTLDPDMVAYWIKIGAKTYPKAYPHELIIEKCSEICNRNYEWFDFANKIKCSRIEKIISKSKVKQ